MSYDWAGPGRPEQGEFGESIWLVTSNELTERLQATGKAVYMLEEIARLIEQGLTDPVSIKAFHAVKREFPGSTIH